MAQPSCIESNKSTAWSFVDLVRWKLAPERFGGGRSYIRRFKDGWVKHNRLLIKDSAVIHQIPPELLAGTAWIEVGGDPSFIDRVAFEVRAFDWSGPSWIDNHFTITRPPSKTSFGSVSMQLRTAARTMGINTDALSIDELRSLAAYLQRDICNIDIVAKHLHDLILHDFPDIETTTLTNDQIKIVGARYNRGVYISLEAIKQNLSYGEFILRMWPYLTELLGEL